MTSPVDPVHGKIFYGFNIPFAKTFVFNELPFCCGILVFIFPAQVFNPFDCTYCFYDNI